MLVCYCPPAIGEPGDIKRKVREGSRIGRQADQSQVTSGAPLRFDRRKWGGRGAVRDHKPLMVRAHFDVGRSAFPVAAGSPRRVRPCGGRACLARASRHAVALREGCWRRPGRLRSRHSPLVTRHFRQIRSSRFSRFVRPRV